MKFRQMCLVLLPGITAVFSCTPNQEASEEAFGVPAAMDGVGMTIVENRGPRWTAGEGWSVASEPSVTVGVLNGPEEYQFVRISAAAAQADGDLVVVDGGAKTVRLFDAEGTFLRTLGGAGSGPGEFQDPGKVFVSAGDSVVVWDASAYRITRFDPEGDLAGVETVELAGLMKVADPPLFPGALEPLRDGDLLVRLVEKGKSFPSGSFRRRSGALRVSADLSNIDTLMFFGDIEEVTVEAPWGEFSLPAPIAKRSWITHQGNPSRICIGDQEAPEILCIGPDQARTLVRWTPRASPLGREEVEDWREATVLSLGEKLSRGQVLQMLDQVPIPSNRPVHSQLILDQAGNLWAKVGPTAGGTPSYVDYLVFDPSGVLLGVVPLPPIQVLEIGRDFVLGVYRDELEVEYLQLFELNR